MFHNACLYSQKPIRAKWHSQTRLSRVTLTQSRRQQGFLIPLSLFIIVACASLALAMSQLAAGSRSSAVLSSLNSQALYAADAGVQSALSQMHFNATTRAAVDANCASVDGTVLNLSGKGIAGCTIEVGCTASLSDDGSVGLYQITSESSCGSGDYETGRRVMIESYMRNL